MATLKHVIENLPEGQLLLAEFEKQKDEEFMQKLGEMTTIHSAGSLIRILDYSKTERGEDFWVNILRREMTPEFAREECGYLKDYSLC